jgi:hypothetical protein
VRVEGTDKIMAGHCSKNMHKGRRIIELTAVAEVTSTLRFQFNSGKGTIKVKLQIKSTETLARIFEEFRQSEEAKGEKAKSWAFSFDGNSLKDTDTLKDLEKELGEGDEIPSDGFLIDVRNSCVCICVCACVSQPLPPLNAALMCS